MPFITNELLKQLPEESRLLIETEGISLEEYEEMTPEEKLALDGVEESSVAKPKLDEELKLSKPLKFGDESEFETKLDDNGKMDELPDSEKNKITDFSAAHERGNALIDKMSDMPELPGERERPKQKVKKDIKQEDLQD